MFPFNVSFKQIVTFKLAILLLCFFSGVSAQTIQLPVKLDFSLLQQLLIMQLFTGPKNTVDIANDSTGCNKIILSNPKLSKHNDHLLLNTQIHALLGVEMLGNCTKMLNWQGRAEFISRPKISAPREPLLYLDVIDSQLYTAQNKRITSGPLWDYTKSRLMPLLGQFKLDLRPTTKEINGLFSEVLPRHSSSQVDQIIDSLKIVDLHLNKSNIAANLFFEITKATMSYQPEQVLSEQEMQAWRKKWQSMDALITNTVKQYASATQFQELKYALFEILIDARYQLQQAMAKPVNHINDPVRSWFIDSWERLLPVLLKISTESPEQAPLALVSMITATDALHALDQLGPSIGLEISTAGLRRLARMLNKSSATDPLLYQETLDPELRRLFLFHTFEMQQPTGLNFDFWPIKSAHAKASNTPLNSWLPTTGELDVYLPRVRYLLTNTAAKTAKPASLNTATLKLYRHLVLTTAWQESCWRQYVTKKHKRVPLASGTGDVGIMQINEKVWRGFYNIQKLRWDIVYNVQAGSEILLNYLLKYAIRKKENQHPGGMDNLARATYSAYNGGPGQLTRYRKNQVPSTHKKIDRAFLEKYKAVQQGNELYVSRCLGVAVPVLAKTKNTGKTVKPASTQNKSRSIKNDVWILKRNENDYTLQLAVFSSLKTAQNFIHDQRSKGSFAIYKTGKRGGIRYGVIYGQFKDRSDAEEVKNKFRLQQPWIRQYKDIQSLM